MFCWGYPLTRLSALPMPDCPRCQQSVDARAITCSYCGASLKAYGHPGIPLHQASGNDYLCATCAYDKDDSCTFPQRPYARECTLYLDYSQPAAVSSSSRGVQVKTWLKRNLGWISLVVLIGISILITLL
jgi:hypothetical protein